MSRTLTIRISDEAFEAIDRRAHYNNRTAGEHLKLAAEAWAQANSETWLQLPARPAQRPERDDDAPLGEPNEGTS